MQTKDQIEKPKGNRIIDGKFIVNFECILGSGSYSNVYLASLKKNPQIKIACKMISKKYINSQIANGDNQNKQKLLIYLIKCIEAQINIGQKIKHPNIVRLQYFSQTQKNIYLFMQRCQGGNIRNLIQQKGPQPEIKALPLIQDIVNGACQLYDENITHRDIKAQNILLKNNRAKIADFGFAKELHEKDNMETGTIVGTYLYMAPQLLYEQKPHYSIKCDVWSIGVVIYYLLYGNLPWEKATNIKFLKVYQNKPIQFPKSMRVSPKMKNLISQMLVFNEEERINIKDVKAYLKDISAKLMDVEE